MVFLKSIAGVGLVLLMAASAGAATPTFPANAAGDWVGTIRADTPRHLFLHIHKTPAGYTASLDSPEGPAGGVAVTPLAADSGILAFAADRGRFRGAWNEARGRWEGTWTEGGSAAPLALSFNDDSTMRTIARHDDGARSPVIEVPGTSPGARSSPPDVVPPAAR